MARRGLSAMRRFRERSSRYWSMTRCGRWSSIFNSVGSSWWVREWDGQQWTPQLTRVVAGGGERPLSGFFDSARGASVLVANPIGYPRMTMVAWDGATVTMPEWPEQPAGRHSHAMAYDSAHAETILFGGLRRNGSGEPEFLDDETWSYDGRDWRLLTTDDPSPRAGHRMAYDTTRERVLLLGGQTDAGLSDELWAWDGSAWSLVTAGGITPRHSFAMAYDSGRDRLIAQSGELGAGEYDRYTWEYDGANWSIVSWTGPYTRYDHAMAYDPVRGVTVLHGGRTIYGPLGDTWEWDGLTWTLKASDSASARYGHNLTFDPVRGVMVMSGGWTVSSVGGATWVWDGVAWQSLGRSLDTANAATTFDEGRGILMVHGGRYPGSSSTSLPRDTTFVLTPPTPYFTQYADDQKVTTLQDVVLTVATRADGCGVAYQWYRDGVELENDGRISGATTGTLTLSPAVVADTGDYTVSATLDGVTLTSIPARLDVLLAGDANCDGAVDGADIDAFVVALVDPAGYAATYPGCDVIAADCNADGAVDTADIDAFVGLLMGTR